MRRRMLTLFFPVCLALLLCSCGGELPEEQAPAGGFADRIVSVCYFGVDFGGWTSAENMVECNHSQLAKQAYGALRLSEWQQIDGPLDGVTENTVIFIPYIGSSVHITLGADTARMDGQVYKLPDGTVEEVLQLLKEHAEEHK